MCPFANFIDVSQVSQLLIDGLGANTAMVDLSFDVSFSLHHLCDYLEI